MEPFSLAIAAAIVSFFGQIVRTVVKEKKQNPERKEWDIIFSVIRRKIFQDISEEEETLDNRVNKLTSSLKEATTLIEQIESEIKVRSDVAGKLKSDIEKTKQEIEQYEKLAKVTEEQSEALARLLRAELAKEGRSNFWKGVLVNFIFFVLGAVASWIINLLTMTK